MRKQLFLLAILMSVIGIASAKQKKTTAIVVENDAHICRLQFYANDIVRVVKYPKTLGEMPAKQSYPVILDPGIVKVAQVEDDDVLCVKTANMQVRIRKASGCITFMTANDSVLLREGQTHLKQLTEGVDKGQFEVGQTWHLDADEPLYGLGQLRELQMSHRGHAVTLWNTNTHISIPYFTTSKGYGVYWDNPGRTFFRDDETGTSMTSEVGQMIDYYFMYRDGTQDGVIACIRHLTGEATMFPLWAMGHWQCRERYKTSDELAEVLDRYRELHIPLDAIVQDWQYWGCDSNWNAMRFMNPYYINKVGDPTWDKYLPDDLKPLAEEYKAKGLQPRLKSPQEMVDYVHKNHAHLMISIWASFGPWTEQYAELKKIGALLPFDTWPLNRGVMPYDVYNPQAREIYWKYLSHLYAMGIDAWWTDSTEPDHFEHQGDDNYMTHDGSWHSIKNVFPLLHNRNIYEHQRKMKGNTKRSLQMTRSGFFGMQHYGTFSWSGDIQASWNEMKNQVPSGLNFTLCGIPFWNTDIGGFFYWDYWNDPKNPALQELHTRWMQWGTFMPLMRNHGSSPMPTELYHFGNPGEWAYDAQVDAVRLRYRLLPYIYSTAGDCVQHAGSMMRALVMDFPNDRTAITLNTEYMFGRELLVKPVTDPLYTWREDQRHGHSIYPDVAKASAPVSVYLPDGTEWYDFFTNRRYDGGKEIQRPTPITELPVFVKAGSILPFGPEVQYSNEKPWDDLEIRVYPGADGSFTLYEDEGDNYNYERGHFTEITFTWNEATQTLTIGNRKGSYTGMLTERQFRIVKVTEQCGRGNQPMTTTKNVHYDGNQITITDL